MMGTGGKVVIASLRPCLSSQVSSGMCGASPGVILAIFSALPLILETDFEGYPGGAKRPTGRQEAYRQLNPERTASLSQI